ncbi:hypothetical protein FB45DRAFT_1028578 [Roridomyces roridus]|uniref:Uncharacterized protein n=1 Tax=Roridomyces roridus TaxID=1738132 RepID=A0AAD7FML3_9AGAR|nr:hypothetical protein FB45DRAFT_1028578 [Roridomyces roridus]
MSPNRDGVGDLRALFRQEEAAKRKGKDYSTCGADLLTSVFITHALHLHHLDPSPPPGEPIKNPLAPGPNRRRPATPGPTSDACTTSALSRRLAANHDLAFSVPRLGYPSLRPLTVAPKCSVSRYVNLPPTGHATLHGEEQTEFYTRSAAPSFLPSILSDSRWLRKKERRSAIAHAEFAGSVQCGLSMVAR